MSESSSHRPDPPRALTIRPLENERDFESCLALQRETWGEDCHELVPPTMLMVSQKVGGIAAGAFDQNGRLVGFVYGLTGLREGRPAHWSHMLAVTETLSSRFTGVTIPSSPVMRISISIALGPRSWNTCRTCTVTIRTARRTASSEATD